MAERKKASEEDLKKLEKWKKTREKVSEEDLRRLEQWRSGDPTAFSPDKKPRNKKVFRGEVVPAPEAFFRALGQSALAGFGDEVSAGFRSIVEGKNFDDVLREERERNEQARRTNPALTFATELGGFAIPSAAATKLIKPATKAARLGQEATLGAIQGAGTADGNKDVMSNMTQGAAYGAAGQQFGEGIQKYTPIAARKLNKTIFGTPEEVTSTLVKNPRYLDDAPESGDLAEMLSNRATVAAKRARENSEKARETLTDAKVEGKDKILAEMDELPEILGIDDVTSDLLSSKTITNELKQYRDAIEKATSQKHYKNIIKDLDEEAKYRMPGADRINRMKKSLRKIIDRQLKAENPEYAKIMKRTDRYTGLSKDADEIFNLELDRRGRRKHTERTVKKMESLKRDIDKDKSFRRRDLTRKLKMAEPIKKSRLLDQSTGGSKHGSRNVDYWSLFGGASNLLRMLTATGGMVVDEYGRTIGSNVARKVGELTPKARATLERVGPLFQGKNQFAVHKMLTEVDPDYVEMLNELLYFDDE